LKLGMPDFTSSPPRRSTDQERGAVSTSLQKEVVCSLCISKDGRSMGCNEFTSQRRDTK
jgi:hypothetical protein